MTMPRSLEEIIAHSNELTDASEDYDPQPGDEGVITPGSLWLIAYRRAQAERQLAEAVRRTSGEAARERYGSKKDGLRRNQAGADVPLGRLTMSSTCGTTLD